MKNLALRLKNLSLTLGLVLSLVGLTACSKQWREVNPGASDDEISSTLDRMQASPQIQAFGSNLIPQIMQDQYGTTYFKKSAKPGASPETVMSLADVTPFISKGVTNVFDLGLQEVSVALVDGVASTSFGDERYFVLMIEMKFATGLPQYFASISEPGSYYFDEDQGVFEAEFTGINGERIVLRSYDLSDEYSQELDATVKFEVFRVNSDGSSSQIGQFAALAGFGG